MKTCLFRVSFMLMAGLTLAEEKAAQVKVGESAQAIQNKLHSNENIYFIEETDQVCMQNWIAVSLYILITFSSICFTLIGN